MAPSSGAAQVGSAYAILPASSAKIRWKPKELRFSHPYLTIGVLLIYSKNDSYNIQTNCQAVTFQPESAGYTKGNMEYINIAVLDEYQGSENCTATATLIGGPPTEPTSTLTIKTKDK
jgi:hypothetical protein